MVGALAVASPHPSPPAAAARPGWGAPAARGSPQPPPRLRAGNTRGPRGPRGGERSAAAGSAGQVHAGSWAWLVDPSLPPSLLGFWVPITGVSSSWPAFGVQGVRGGPAPGPFRSPVCCVHSLWLERGLGWALWTKGTSRAQAQFQQPLGEKDTPKPPRKPPSMCFLRAEVASRDSGHKLLLAAQPVC